VFGQMTFYNTHSNSCFDKPEVGEAVTPGQ